ncbi:MAG: serine/threonine-protein kinase [Planctomycetota bacterium]
MDIAEMETRVGAAERESRASTSLPGGVRPRTFQKRIRLLHAIVLALGAVFFTLANLARIAKEPRPLGEWFLGPANLINFLQIALNLSFVVVLGRVRFGARTLQVLDVGGTMAIAAVCSAYAWWERFIPGQEHHAILAASNLLVLRSVLVPALPRSAVGLALFAAVATGLPLVAHEGFGFASSRPDGILRFAFFLSWSLISLILSVVVCRVIHGLRREVRDAQELGQYTLRERIGAGGMGAVFRASHRLLRRPCAVKILAPERIDEDDIRRFEREVQLTSELTHPNTVAIYDYGKTEDGIFYYAMELLSGLDLSSLVRRFGPQYPGRVIHILAQAAGSLGEAHARGLVHRDVKPANIFLCNRGGRDDTVKVLDFGLVKAAEDEDADEEGILGTPRYLAPESIVARDEVDARADIYALAAVGYFLLTGTHVFQGRTVKEVMRQHVSESPEAPSARLGKAVPEDLEALILDGLAKDPAARPATAEAFLERLTGLRGAAMWNAEVARTWWDKHLPDRGAPAASRADEGDQEFQSGATLRLGARGASRA